MKLETANTIKKAAEMAGIEIEVYEGYSGRGMYGRKTTGLSGSKSDIVKATAMAFFSMGEAGDPDGEEMLEDLDWAWDSLGRDEIAY